MDETQNIIDTNSEDPENVFVLPPEETEAVFNFLSFLEKNEQRIDPTLIPDGHPMSGSVVSLFPYHKTGRFHKQAKLSVDNDSFKVVTSQLEKTYTARVEPYKMEDNRVTVDQAASVLELMLGSTAA